MMINRKRRREAPGEEKTRNTRGEAKTNSGSMACCMHVTGTSAHRLPRTHRQVPGRCDRTSHLERELNRLDPYHRILATSHPSGKIKRSYSSTLRCLQRFREPQPGGQTARPREETRVRRSASSPHKSPHKTRSNMQRCQSTSGGRRSRVARKDPTGCPDRAGDDDDWRCRVARKDSTGCPDRAGDRWLSVALGSSLSGRSCLPPCPRHVHRSIGRSVARFVAFRPLLPSPSVHRSIGRSVARFVAFGPLLPCPSVHRSIGRSVARFVPFGPILPPPLSTPCSPVDWSFRRSVRRFRATPALPLCPPVDWSFHRSVRPFRADPASPPVHAMFTGRLVVPSLGSSLSGHSCLAPLFTPCSPVDWSFRRAVRRFRATPAFPLCPPVDWSFRRAVRRFRAAHALPPCPAVDWSFHRSIRRFRAAHALPTGPPVDWSFRLDWRCRRSSRRPRR